MSKLLLLRCQCYIILEMIGNMAFQLLEAKLVLSQFWRKLFDQFFYLKAHTTLSCKMTFMCHACVLNSHWYKSWSRRWYTFWVLLEFLRTANLIRSEFLLWMTLSLVFLLILCFCSFNLSWFYFLGDFTRFCIQSIERLAALWHSAYAITASWWIFSLFATLNIDTCQISIFRTFLYAYSLFLLIIL